MKKLGILCTCALFCLSFTWRTASAEINMSAFEWEAPEETVTIAYYGGQELPETNEKEMEIMHEFLLKYFNIDLQRIVYENDTEERLAMMLASGDYPDVIACMTPSQAKNWEDMGKAIDMKPYLDAHAPNFIQSLGDMYQRYINHDGAVFSLPNIWGILPICDFAPQIRYDWWSEAGQNPITTPESYHDTLKALVEAHPENADGQKTYALGFIKGRKNYELVGAMWGLKKGFHEDADHTLTFFPGTDEGWELTRYINQFTLEGLLDPDSFVMTMDEWVQKLASQRYAGHLDSWWPVVYTQTYWPETVENYDPMTDLFVHVDVHTDDLEASTINPKNANGTYRTIVTDHCKNPEIVAKFINFEHSALGLKLLGWGVPANYEGIVPGADNDYAVWYQTEDSPGWAYVEEHVEELLANSFNSTRHSYMGGSGVASFTFDQRFQEDGTSCWYDQCFNDQIWWRGFMNDNMKASCFDFSAFLGIQIPEDEDISMQWQQIQDVVSSMFVEAVMAESEEACRAIYDSMVEKVNALGMKEVNDWFTAQYTANLKAWGMMD